MITAIEAPCLLVVEGKDEENFFKALLGHLRLDEDNTRIQILSIEGASSLRDKFRALSNTHGFSNVTSLGVVRDADDDPPGALMSIRDALEYAGLPAPTDALIPFGANPIVTIMLLPTGRPGTLEDVCLEAVQTDPAISCVNQYFECLRTSGISSFQNRSKSQVHAFLASRREPKRLGEAALAGYWPWNAPAFGRLTDFLYQIAVKV